jgi:hypothetical protein
VFHAGTMQILRLNAHHEIRGFIATTAAH